MSLSTAAKAFRVLTDGQTLDGAYRFASLTMNTLERRLDAVLEPAGRAGPDGVTLGVRFAAWIGAAPWRLTGGLGVAAGMALLVVASWLFALFIRVIKRAQGEPVGLAQPWVARLRSSHCGPPAEQSTVDFPSLSGHAVRVPPVTAPRMTADEPAHE